MLVCFDTETTGLPDWRAPSESDHQPHLVQLAMILLDDEMKEQASASLLIRPDGWTIPDDVAKIHGTTTEHAQKFGVEEKLATRLWASLVYGLGATAIGHNISFDLRIMRIAMLRAGFTKEWLDSREVKSFCTMTECSPILALPRTEKMKAAGFLKHKPPNLGECIQHFFQESLDGAHDAMIDARASLRLYRHLKTAEVVAKEPDEIVI